MYMSKNKFVNIKTNFGVFKCRFEPNTPEKGYTATVPKLPGVVTCGDNLKEAVKMAKEAIELHCECLLDSGLAELKMIRFPKASRRLASLSS